MDINLFTGGGGGVVLEHQCAFKAVKEEGGPSTKQVKGMFFPRR